MPVPLMLRPAPLRVMAPAPPGRWLKLPAPTVAKLPATFRLVLVAPVTLAPLMVRLLKLFTPVPLIIAPLPLKVTEPLLLKVPSFVQFLRTECAKLLPLKVVPAPRMTSPLIVRAAPAVKETASPVPTLLLSVPASVSGLAGMVLMTAPALLLSVRLP